MPESGAEDFLVFDDVKKSYDQRALVVKGFSMDVREGEFITLLGPSGSGKTTVLMMLAGFESVTSGDIRLSGRSITRIAPYRRNIGMVFQNYALFPHMTVAENLAYPLSVRGLAKDAIRAKVDEYLALVELSGFGGRHPAQLSGGQRQRVALARAMIFSPSLILMDEPLGALDKKLREQMQYEITRIHETTGFTVIYVTHDQAEALSMSDRIAVFNDGVVQQCAPPAELYERPANAFVAEFIGENNFIPGTVDRIEGGRARIAVPGGQTIVADAGGDLAEGGRASVSIRPEKLFLAPSDHPHDNEMTARFVTRAYVGDFIRYYFRLDGGGDIVVKVLNDRSAPDLSEGDTGRLQWLISDGIAFPGAAAATGDPGP